MLQQCSEGDALNAGKARTHTYLLAYLLNQSDAMPPPNAVHKQASIHSVMDLADCCVWQCLRQDEETTDTIIIFIHHSKAASR